MPTPVIVIGDRTSHGGEVISGSPVTDTHGKSIARVGDFVSCPKRGHGTNQIVTGDLTMIIDGQAVARHGDKTACGAVLLASQKVTTEDPGGGTASTASSSLATASGGVDAGAVADVQATDALASPPPLEDEPHAIRFQAVDPSTGQPIPKCVYLLTHEDGSETGGVTDSQGFTKIVETARPEKIAVHFVFKSPKGENLEREDLA